MSAVANLIRIRDVQGKVSLSDSHIYALIAEGDFPAPIKLGPRASAWVESEIDEWIAERIAASRKAAA